MEYIYIFLGGVFIVGFIILSYFNKGDKTEKDHFMPLLQKVAVQFGLERTGDHLYPAITGKVGDFPVFIKKKLVSHEEISVFTLTYEILLPEKKLPAFSISSEGFITEFKRYFGVDDIQIGDPYFDDIVRIKGNDVTWLLSVLNKPVREMIKDFMQSAYSGYFSITEKALNLSIEFMAMGSAKKISLTLDMLLELAKTLCRGENAVEVIKNNYLTESEQGVKYRLLDALADAAVKLPADDPTMTAALEDKDPVIRFKAALLLNTGRYPVISNLYETGTPSLRKLIINRLKEIGDGSLMEFLQERLPGEESIEVKTALMEYFREMGNDRVEPSLRKELKAALTSENSPNDLTYARNIIRALKKCGTYETIEPLHNIRHFILKQDAAETIKAIRDRIGSGEEGWLSFGKATNTEGSLSFIEKHQKDISDNKKPLT
ncbi:MAG: hypothetical protein JW969_01765 [Spirochaetales bacterium]|nr:hypothetical protein [Spirochaetales bacterium]